MNKQQNQKSKPYRVLCVCLGNICRSPTAEVILREQAQRQGLIIHVDSAGTSNYHPNKAPDLRSQKYALQAGYDLSALRARQIQAQDFIDFDLILAMDLDNLVDIQALYQRVKAGLPSQKHAKIALMSEHDLHYPKQAVPDPYYGNESDFKRVIAQCESSSLAWIEHWQKYSFVSA